MMFIEIALSLLTLAAPSTRPSQQATTQPDRALDVLKSVEMPWLGWSKRRTRPGRALVFLKSVESGAALRAVAVYYRPETEREEAMWTVTLRSDDKEQVLATTTLAREATQIFPLRWGNTIRGLDAVLVDDERIVVLIRVGPASFASLLRVPKPGNPPIERSDSVEFCWDSNTGIVLEEAAAFVTPDANAHALTVYFKLVNEDTIRTTKMRIEGTKIKMADPDQSVPGMPPRLYP